jgi:uroporphyrinogen-III synthase
MKTVLVIRPREKWEVSRSIVETYGLQAQCASVLRVEYLVPPDAAGIIDGLRSGHYRSVVFSSVTAVHAFERSMGRIIDIIAPGTELVAIGPPTARALMEKGAGTVALPSEFTSEGLVDHLLSGSGDVLMLRSDHGSDVLRKGLEGRRPLIEVIMYSLREERDGSLDAALRSLSEGEVDAVLHTSSLSARLTVERARELYGEGYRWEAMNAAIGPPTRDTLVSLGLDVKVTPDKATFPELVAAVAKALGQ